jgi:hypothetical protein
VFIVQFVENKIENPKHKFSSSASEPAFAKTGAMRASGDTNCGLPSVVVVLTNFQFLYRTAKVLETSLAGQIGCCPVAHFASGFCT